MAKSRKVSFKKVFGLILLLLVVVTVVGSITAYKSRDTKTISSTEFSRGGLDESGEYVKTDKTLYTKEMFECKGLKITQDFESNLSYRVYFYGYDEKFLTFSDRFHKENKEFDVPSYAKYARVVLIPDGDEDISFFDVYGIANDVEITVSKEQPDAPVDYYQLAKLNNTINKLEDVPTELSKGEIYFFQFHYVSYNDDLTLRTEYSKDNFVPLQEEAIQEEGHDYVVIKLDCDKVAKYKLTFGEEVNTNPNKWYYLHFFDADGKITADTIVRYQVKPFQEIIVDVPANASYLLMNVLASSDGEYRELPIVINEYLSR